MRTHPSTSAVSSQRNATWEETTSKRGTGRNAKKKPSVVEMSAEGRSPGSNSRRNRRLGAGVGPTGFSSPAISPEVCIIGEGGPARRTRLSERTASECGPNVAPEPPRLRRSPRVHDNMEQQPIDVWRSPRRRASGLVSPKIKEEPIVVGIDDVPSKSGATGAELAAPVLAEQSPPPLESLVGDTEDIHRREGSTETMAMCEEGSDESLFDGENEESRQPIEAVTVVGLDVNRSAKEVADVTPLPTKGGIVVAEALELAVAQSSGKRTSGKSKSKADRSPRKLTTIEEPILSPKKKKLEPNLAADICLPLQQSEPSKIVSPKKKGNRRRVSRTRDAPLESIPPLKHAPSEQHTEVVTPDEEPMELSSEMFYNFAQSMPVPISRSDFADKNAIEPLKRRVSMALRELLDGAKLFAMEARRERVTHNDVNAFMRQAHLPPLYGFMEDESWLKVGDVFVPNEKSVQLNSLPGSIKVQTERLIDFKSTMVYANR